MVQLFNYTKLEIFSKIKIITHHTHFNHFFRGCSYFANICATDRKNISNSKNSSDLIKSAKNFLELFPLVIERVILDSNEFTCNIGLRLGVRDFVWTWSERGVINL